MNHVLDACAMVAYTEGERGGSVVASLLSDPAAVCYAHSVNLCEVYYQGIRRSDPRTARAAITSLYRDGVIERRDMSRRFWQRVGGHKARGRISLADCICIALAEDSPPRSSPATTASLTRSYHSALFPLGLSVRTVARILAPLKSSLAERSLALRCGAGSASKVGVLCSTPHWHKEPLRTPMRRGRERPRNNADMPPKLERRKNSRQFSVIGYQ